MSSTFEFRGMKKFQPNLASIQIFILVVAMAVQEIVHNESILPEIY
jgi:hypothetical protein